MINSISVKRIVSTRDGPSYFSALRRIVMRTVAARRNNVAQQRIATALSTLSDHTLKDIGVPRSDIYAVARTIAENDNEDRQA